MPADLSRVAPVLAAVCMIVIIYRDSDRLVLFFRLYIGKRVAPRHFDDGAFPRADMSWVSDAAGESPNPNQSRKAINRPCNTLPACDQSGTMPRNTTSRSRTTNM